jgi:hypothetical protein
VVAKHSNNLRCLHEVLNTQRNPESPEDEILVKDRSSGDVVYRESISEGPAVAGTVKKFQDDMEQLDLGAFCEKYGISGYPPG